jgi:acetoacetyl-CoA reductase
MSNTNKITLPSTFLSGDNVMFNPWLDAVDAGFNSLGQLFEFSNVMFRRMARQQNVALDTYLDTVVDRIPGVKKKPIAQKQLKTGVAVVTGGIGGLGTDICKRLAADSNHIVSTYLAAEKEAAEDWKKEREREGITVELHECDVIDFESCRAMARAIEQEHGHIHVLVNCAGITRDATFKKMSVDNWHAVLDTNLDSVFNVTRQFIDGMVKNGYGRIINISSVNGQKGQFGQTNYSAAKAGMIGFTRSLALELADTGVTVNCICPGYVGTSMVEAIREDILQAIIDQIPMGRLAQPDEIAAAVAFLASRESSYITGTELAINGGLWLG